MGGIRHKLQHLGDIFVGSLEKTAGAAKKCARGVVLTYDIHEIKKKRRNYLKEIGKRLASVKKEGLVDVKSDDKLMELYPELGELEKTLEAYKKERDEMIHQCGSKPDSAEKAS